MRDIDRFSLLNNEEMRAARAPVGGPVDTGGRETSAFIEVGVPGFVFFLFECGPKVNVFAIDSPNDMCEGVDVEDFDEDPENMREDEGFLNGNFRGFGTSFPF